jgi:hypothetical protein
MVSGIKQVTDSGSRAARMASKRNAKETSCFEEEQ